MEDEDAGLAEGQTFDKERWHALGVGELAQAVWRPQQEMLRTEVACAEAPPHRAQSEERQQDEESARSSLQKTRS